MKDIMEDGKNWQIEIYNELSCGCTWQYINNKRTIRDFMLGCVYHRQKRQRKNLRKKRKKK